MAEKGYYTYDLTGRYGWLGHYQFVTGYDETKGVLVVQDTYMKNGRKSRSSRYDEFIGGWRPFDYLFMVVYPLRAGGRRCWRCWAIDDPDWASPACPGDGTGRGADADRASTSTLPPLTWAPAMSPCANMSTLLMLTIMPSSFMPPCRTMTRRPYRMLWYQTGPYFAYYYSGRYQDVIDLANVTFDTIGEDVLEESFLLARHGLAGPGLYRWCHCRFPREPCACIPGLSTCCHQLD